MKKTPEESTLYRVSQSDNGFCLWIDEVPPRDTYRIVRNASLPTANRNQLLDNLDLLGDTLLMDESQLARPVVLRSETLAAIVYGDKPFYPLLDARHLIREECWENVIAAGIDHGYIEQPSRERVKDQTSRILSPQQRQSLQR